MTGGPDAVVRQYASADAARLMSGARGWLGAVRLRQELTTALQPRSSVFDCGGGNGVVAQWLLDQGHRVHLEDVVPELVAEANRILGHRAGFTSAVGDARDIAADDGTYDAVVALGPYYHLLDSDDRAAMLAEAARVVRPGGTVVVEFMGRRNFDLWAAHSALDDVESLRAVAEIDENGTLRNDGRSDRLFLTCRTDTAEEMRAAAQAAGLHDVRTVALEGPFWPASVAPRGALPRDEAARLVALTRRAASDDACVDLSPHSLLVSRRGPDVIQER